MPVSETKRQRSVSDAASALLGIAGTPELPAPQRQKLSHLPSQTSQQAARSNWKPDAYAPAHGLMLPHEVTYSYAASNASSDDDAHSWTKPMNGSGGAAPVLAPGLVERATHVPHLSPYKSATGGPTPDAQLLTSAAVLLASCGLVHALNVSTEGKAPISRSHGATPPRSSASSTSEELDAAEKTPPAVADSDTSQVGTPLVAPARGAAELEAMDPSVLDAVESAQGFGNSVWRILRQECAHVRALERPDFAKLCQILDLPLEL